MSRLNAVLLVLTSVRIATAGGEASFISPSGVVHTNDFGRGWEQLPEGTEVVVCAEFPQTHTYMLTLTIPQPEGEPVLTQGVVLRQKSYDKLQAVLGTPEEYEARQVEAPEPEVEDSDEDSEDEGPTDDQLEALDDATAEFEALMDALEADDEE